jgi:hypothetical protein
MARVAAVTLDYPPRRWIGSELATHVMLSALSEAGTPWVNPKNPSESRS